MAAKRGYKKGNNRCELDYFLRKHALSEGFPNKKCSGEIYRFLKVNNWVLDTSAANNLGDYQTTVIYVNSSDQHVLNNFYGPTFITNLQRRMQANMLGYMEEHNKLEGQFPPVCQCERTFDDEIECFKGLE